MVCFGNTVVDFETSVLDSTDPDLKLVIKQRMQIQNSSKMYRSMVDCAKYVYRNEGLGAFYISYPTTLSMTVPFTALQFLAYESISTAMNPQKNYDPFTHCLAGAVAGGFAAGLTTPMDVIKTILQTRGTSSDPQVRNVNSFLGGCQLLYQREGLRGFFKGVRPRVVTTMPSTAICWSAYEFSKYDLFFPLSVSGGGFLCSTYTYLSHKQSLLYQAKRYTIIVAIESQNLQSGADCSASFQRME